MDFDLEKLKKESEDAQDEKAMYGVIGQIAQGFSDVPSSYELLKGKSMGPKSNAKGVMDAVASTVVDPMEKQKKTYEMYKAAKENAQLKEQSDPNSRQAKAAKALLISRGISPQDLEGLTYQQLVSLHGDPGKMAEIKAQSAVNFQNQVELEKLKQRGELAKYNAEQAKKNNPQERMKNLASGDKARLDNAKMILKAIDEMGAALDSGENTFSLIGDNNYTANELRAAEAFGRMQSGGAINKEEEERFRKMLPRARDSKEMQRKKLLTQREEMLSRLKTLGFTPEDVGYVAKDFKYGAPEGEAQTAQAGAKTPVKKQYNPQLKKTRITYSDGTIEELDGRQ